MKPPFILKPDAVSDSTVKALQNLLEDAKQGNLIGISFAAMYTKPNRTYVTNTAGEARRNPTFAIGTVIILLYKLIIKVTGK